ncbi:alpha/beta hydrolase [uncultured Sphingomonas sp.]|uniref:alpha/beta fold hydrolase n=1 Tax=uncultured Sphingomonas sp. TaxID=158754 RepID=UPI0030F7F984
MRRTLWTTIVIGGLLLTGNAYQQVAERIDAARYPAPGRMISVGDHRLHLWCAGRGAPTVLLLSGDGTPSVTMYAAQRRIAAFTRVCSYDRAGLGWSDPPSHALGLGDQVDDLDRLLSRAGIATPLVLVPESGGNVIALSYLDRAPRQVAGMVMVDGSEPALWFRGSPDEFAMLRLTDPLWQAGWRLGIVRSILPYAVPSWVEDLPPDLRGQFDAVWSRAMPGQARDPIDRWERTPVAERPQASAGMLRDRPLIVIRHGVAGGMGVPEKYEAEWPAAQARLARLSRVGEMVVATRNHHPIAEENPPLVSE